MKCNPLPASRPAALHLLGDLADYRREFQLLLDTWLDADQFEIVNADIERLRSACALFDRLAVPWTSLLATHCELVHAMWVLAAAQGTDPDAQERATTLRSRHADCVANLGAALTELGLDIQDVPGGR